MLRSYIFYHFLRTSFLGAFLLSVILFSLQFVRLSGILLGVPLKDFLGFFTVWSVFYTYFFLPDGVILATASLINSLKERRLVHVFYSFGISDLKILYFFSFPFVALYLLLVSLSGTLIEEKVAFVRKNLLFKYQDSFFREVPVKTFVGFGGAVIYVDEREGDRYKNVFFKFRDITILSRELEYKGKGVFLFKRGTVITEEESLFIVGFERYTLNLRQFEKKGLREKRVRESVAINVANAVITPILFLGVFFFCLKFCTRVSHFYGAVAFFIILHQLIIFAVKVLL
ncbi:LptF/LptG family permease [Aquifex pyrophilus]